MVISKATGRLVQIRAGMACRTLGSSVGLWGVFGEGVGLGPPSATLPVELDSFGPLGDFGVCLGGFRGLVWALQFQLYPLSWIL